MKNDYTPYASCGLIGFFVVSLARACCQLRGHVGPIKAKGRIITTDPNEPNGCNLLRKAQFKDETYTLDSENLQEILPPFKDEVSVMHLVHSHFEKRANHTPGRLKPVVTQHIDFI